MSKAFHFRGNKTVGAYVERCLSAAGYVSEEDVLCADVVLTYSTNQESLEEMYFGEEGIVQNANPGTILIDLSPSTPTFSRELNAVCVVNDKVMVEAPLIVLHPGFEDAFSSNKAIACLVGGEEASLKEAMPVLELLASNVEDMGGAGSAQLGKAAYTLQMVAQIVSAIEADALYRAVRVQNGSFDGEASRAGTLTSTSAEVIEAICASRFDGNYTIEMFLGELTAALSAADDADLILPQAEAAMHLLDLLAVVGGVDKAASSVSLMYRDEEACAQAGLDWSRANEVYEHEHDGCDHDHHHDEEDFADYGDAQFYPGLGYSAN